jgi:hypothetical protein
MPGHEDTVAGAKELDFAPQRFDNVKILVNASDIFFEIVFSAGSGSRLEKLSYIESHCKHTRQKRNACPYIGSRWAVPAAGCIIGH